MLVFLLQWISLHWKIILIMLLSQFPLTFHQTQKGCPPFQGIAYNNSRADWDGFCGHLRDVPSKDIFKLGASTATCGCRSELMYISLMLNIRSSLTHLHGCQLLVLLPYFVEITFFVCTSSINLLNLKPSSGKLVIIGKGFLKLPHLHMLIKQRSLSLPRNLALRIFDELQIVSSI